MHGNYNSMMQNIAYNPTDHDQPFLVMGITTFTVSVGADFTFFPPLFLFTVDFLSNVIS